MIVLRYGGKCDQQEGDKTHREIMHPFVKKKNADDIVRAEVRIYWTPVALDRRNYDRPD